MYLWAHRKGKAQKALKFPVRRVLLMRFLFALLCRRPFILRSDRHIKRFIIMIEVRVPCKLQPRNYTTLIMGIYHARTARLTYCPNLLHALVIYSNWISFLFAGKPNTLRALEPFDGSIFDAVCSGKKVSLLHRLVTFANKSQIIGIIPCKRLILQRKNPLNRFGSQNSDNLNPVQKEASIAPKSQLFGVSEKLGNPIL